MLQPLIWTLIWRNHFFMHNDKSLSSYKLKSARYSLVLKYSYEMRSRDFSLLNKNITIRINRARTEVANKDMREKSYTFKTLKGKIMNVDCPLLLVGLSDIDEQSGAVAQFPRWFITCHMSDINDTNYRL